MRLKMLTAPPLMVLYFSFVILLINRSPSFDLFGLNSLAAVPIVGGGLSLILWANLCFKRAKTTINPFRVKEASHLVIDGPFCFSRNPMYLGMAIILCGVVLFAGNVLGFALVGFFVHYINRAQIYREEKAMAELFGEDWQTYRARVRPWV